MRMKQTKDVKQQMIETALHLLTAKDQMGQISLRAVAREVSLTPADVQYHFKSKRRFLQELWRTIANHRGIDFIAEYSRKNRRLLKTRDGKVFFIDGLIGGFAGCFEEFDEPERLGLIFLLSELVRGSGTCARSARQCLRRDQLAFYRICHAIDPEVDRVLARIWFDMTFIPLIFTRFVTPVDERGAEWENRIQRMQGCCKRILLANLGLRGFAIEESEAGQKRLSRKKGKERGAK